MFTGFLLAPQAIQREHAKSSDHDTYQPQHAYEPKFLNFSNELSK